MSAWPVSTAIPHGPVPGQTRKGSARNPSARDLRHFRRSRGAPTPVCLNVWWYHHGEMLIRTVTCSLKPTAGQSEALLATMEAFNAACDYISSVAWEQREFNNYRLRKLTYALVRQRFDLPAQLAQQAIAKVSAAYKVSKKTKAEFRPHRRCERTTSRF